MVTLKAENGHLEVGSGHMGGRSSVEGARKVGLSDINANVTTWK